MFTCILFIITGVTLCAADAGTDYSFDAAGYFWLTVHTRTLGHSVGPHCEPHCQLSHCDPTL